MSAGGRRTVTILYRRRDTTRLSLTVNKVPKGFCVFRNVSFDAFTILPVAFPGK